MNAEGGEHDGWFLLLDQEFGKKYSFAASERYGSQRVAPGTKGRLPRKSSKILFDQLEEFRRSASVSELPEAETTLDTLLRPPFTMESFTFLKVLGRGSFGKVFLAEEKETKAVRKNVSRGVGIDRC